MRITGGTLRGRTLKAPNGISTRPTSDRVREALFNILAHHEWPFDPLDTTVVLDAFAGTGALGLEALSRGSASCFFFEKDRNALKTLKENINLFGLQQQATVWPLDVSKPPVAPAPCSLVFLDPPYHKNLIPPTLAALNAQGWLAPRALLVMETAKNEELTLPENVTRLLDRAYGDTAISFWMT